MLSVFFSSPSPGEVILRKVSYALKGTNRKIKGNKICQIVQKSD